MAQKPVATPAVRGGGGGGGGVGLAPFLVKTHQMVEDSGTDEVISWNEEGDSFVVWKPVEFARDLLPSNFKHNNFSSFVRQLNTYGFRKVVPERWEFANDHFRRGEQRLLSEIRRRKTSNAQANIPARHNAAAAAAAPNNSRVDDDQSSASTSTLSTHEHKQLTEENEKLRKDNQALSSELARARQHCEELLSFLSQHVDLDKVEPGLMKTTGGSAGRAAVKGVQREFGAGVGGDKEKEKGEGEESSLRLFGVWLPKRRRCEEGGEGGGGRPGKKTMMGYGSRWIEVISSSPAQGTSRV